MSDKLLEALKIVEAELRTLSLKDFEKACDDCNRNIPRAIDITLLFVNTVIQQRHRDDGDVLSLILPIGNKPIPEHSVQTSQGFQYAHELIIPIGDEESLPVKAPCLFPIETNLPIESIPTFSQNDGEDPPPVLFVPKTPYSDTTSYIEDWSTDPKDK